MAWLYCSSLPSNFEMIVRGWVFFILFLFSQTDETAKAPLFFQDTDYLRTSMDMKSTITQKGVQDKQRLC